MFNEIYMALHGFQQQSSHALHRPATILNTFPIGKMKFHLDFNFTVFEGISFIDDWSVKIKVSESVQLLEEKNENRY